MCIGVILLSIHDFMKKQLSNRFLLLGMTMMLVIGLCDMIHFFIVKYWVVSKDIHYTSILCVGTMVFVLYLFYQYISILVEEETGKVRRLDPAARIFLLIAEISVVVLPIHYTENPMGNYSDGRFYIG